MSYILLGDYMKIIKYLGLFLLICFTFFYTEKVVNVINNNDELMIDIKDRAINYEIEAIDAVIDNDTIIPGKYGKVVNIDKSYYNMKSSKVFNDRLLFYDIVKPNISLNSKEMINKLNQNRLANKYILENILSNDFLPVVPEEVKNIRKVLSRYSGLEHSLSGCGPSYFIAFRKNILNLGVNAILKKEFPDYKFYDVVNTDYRKILVKYK